MIRYKDQLRMTESEMARLEEITGFVPVDVKTEDDLRTFIAKCKLYYDGCVDTARLHRLIDRTVEGMMV